MSEYLLIAKVISIYGKDGFLRLESYSDFPDRFLNLKTAFVEFYASFKQLEVKKVKYDGEDVLIKFDKFDSEKDVLILVGKEIYIQSKDIALLPDDTYYIHDLVGSKVFLKQQELGIITDVMIMPANDVYVVQKDSEELLIPAVKEFIDRFDPIAKVLVLSDKYPGYDNEN